jgi:hypothetical protein
MIGTVLKGSGQGRTLSFDQGTQPSPEFQIADFKYSNPF